MFLPCLPAALLPLLSRGARVFRAAGPSQDRIVTVPGRAGDVVLVPRGHGSPRLAREVAGQFRDSETGVVLSTSRWEPAGSVAAYLREASAPRLSTPVPPVRLRAGGATLLRVHRLGTTAARCTEAASAVVSAGRVRSVNAKAAAKGLAVGARASEAAVLGVVTVAPGDERARLEALGGWLRAEYGEVQRVRGGFLVAGVPEAHGAAGLGALVDLRARVWQATGLCAKIVAGPTAQSALTLGRRLPGNYVGMVTDHAAWGRPADVQLRLGTTGRWQGRAMADVEGLVVQAQALLAAARGEVRVTLTTPDGPVALALTIPAGAGRAEVYSRVEAALRRALGSGKSVSCVAWASALPQPVRHAEGRQVALWA